MESVADDDDDDDVLLLLLLLLLFGGGMGDELREVLASNASLIPFSIASNSARGLFAAV